MRVRDVTLRVAREGVNQWETHVQLDAHGGNPSKTLREVLIAQPQAMQRFPVWLRVDQAEFANVPEDPQTEIQGLVRTLKHEGYRVGIVSDEERLTAGMALADRVRLHTTLHEYRGLNAHELVVVFDDLTRAPTDFVIGNVELLYADVPRAADPRRVLEWMHESPYAWRWWLPTKRAYEMRLYEV